MARWSWALAEDYGFRSSTHSSKWLVTHALETATSLASIGACTHVDIAAHTQINIILKNKKLLMVVFEVRALYSPGCPGPQTLRSSCLCLLSLYFYKMSVKWIKAVCFPCQKKKKSWKKSRGQGASSVGMSDCYKSKTLSSNLSKAGLGCKCLQPQLEDRDGQILGACWPVSLAKKRSFRFSERCCLKRCG